MKNFETVWQEYQQSLKAFLHSRVSSPDDVEDILQDVLVKTYEKLDTVQNWESLKSWLFQIANNAIMDFYRKRARQSSVDERDLWYTNAEEEPTQDFTRCLLPFIQTLPEQSAKLIFAVDIQQESQKSLALQENISYSTLKSRVHKARQELKKQFEDCCHVTLGKNGGMIDCDSKSKSCDSC
ncbi:putative RNA polymerase sigma-Z type factor [Vibrio nigripulchritudo MADA3029]|uniref:RNA polymerase sigma factor SigZ n=1 Tax=Vibrio nigripulchritudo TaxID=28173 RepID=UPI0003B1C2BA|nr:RNA polymerase sigma factor SigZ [Vibrio nigripulchritudo]CCN49878.1 putative RNA polymerase sigma-Z type factor [Vibrio nigripulchritudo MADA3020]CCN56478.1 putative RNA polymerase sigma-Z type factor [Vibrio nigripulchritudo MADA3021]CCN62027.1 putative RNA polymerase sigma-Z type factor [Vibrio nigripulchritudo MADA3029]